jgi:hypothetical protein
LQRWLYGRGVHAVRKRKAPVPAFADPSPRIDHTVAVIPRKPRRTPSTTFREVRLPALGPARAGWVAEVTWPSGVTVRFSDGAEAAWIKAVLEAVRQAC